MATKRRTTRKKKSVEDSAVRNATLLSDGCNPELVKVIVDSLSKS